MNIDIDPFHAPKREKNRCSICGSNIVNGVCAVCGWVQIIFPNQVPSEISDFDTQRKEIARNLYKGACTSKKETEELRRTIDAEVSKNKTLEDNLKEEKAKTRAVEQEKERYRTQVDKTAKELASLKDVNQRMVKDAQRMISQNQSLKTERDNALRKIEELQQNPPVSGGAQIRVTEKNGKYILYDECGVVRRSNGAAIGKSGIELYDGYIFQIGEVLFKVQTPEFNIDNLIL